MTENSAHKTLISLRTTPPFSYFYVLARERRLVIGIPFVIAVIALIISVFLPRWYTATAKIMPPQQNQTAALALIGQQLGNLAGTAGQALGLKNPSDVYVAMLKSRTVADNIIEQFELKQIYGEELLHDTRKKLARNSSISSSRDGIITVEVDDKNPGRAADIANSYITELQALAQRIAFSEASQRRLFFETQLKKAKNDLTEAEQELRSFSQKSGVISPQGQLAASVAAASALRAQITVKEIELASVRTFATDNNPDLKRVHQELAALRVELGRMEANPTANKGDVMVSFGKAPELGLEYIRRFRDVQYFEALFELLAKQYEIARIDEARDATLIQVIDKAIPPEKSEKPNITLTVLLSFFASLVIVITVVLARDALGGS